MANPVVDDQPLPLPGNKTVLPVLQKFYANRPYDRVAEDIAARQHKGYVKYGSWLMTHNGRSAYLDLYQELCDAIIYAQQKEMELIDLDMDTYQIGEIQGIKSRLMTCAAIIRFNLENQGILPR